MQSVFCLASLLQEDCSQQESAQEEPVQRSADLDDLDDLDMEIVEQGKGDGVDVISPPTHYLSQSRSLSRLSKMDTGRVSITRFFCFDIYCSPLDVKPNSLSVFQRCFLLLQMWLDTCL